MKPNSGTFKSILSAQGADYLVTRVWPLVAMRSFERLTGPKTDKWLVKTVGVLVEAIGGSLMVAAAEIRLVGKRGCSLRQVPAVLR